MPTEIQVLTFEIIWHMSLELAKQIQKSNYKPDILIGISRGGLVVTRLLSDLLEIPKTAVIGVGFYKDINVTNEEPRLTQDIDVNLHNLKIILIDDVSDSGKSLEFTSKYLEEKRIRDLKTATLHFKSQSIFKPDYYVKETSSWIVYPWEYKEFTKHYISEKMSKGVDKKLIKNKLLELGLPKKIINEF